MMNRIQPILGSFLRRSNDLCHRFISTSGGPLCFQVTPVLGAAPLKKKRPQDLAIQKAREDRKRKKIARAIRLLEKNEGQLKPIQECEVTLKLRNELKLRERVTPTMSELEEDERRENVLQWARHRYKQHILEVAMITRAVSAQEKALAELKMVSETLWREALHEDQSLFPFTAAGPTRTLPIDKYEHPDGDYVDVTKQWD